MPEAAQSVLLIAFHFPPLAESSGLMRTLCLARDLPHFNWHPHVLTATTNAYETVSDDQLAGATPSFPVYRAFAVDTRKSLSFRGRYPDFLAVPDRYVSWLPAAVLRGLLAVWKKRIRVVWSTYPIATTHLVAAAVSRLTGTQWIADFRDPMVEYNETRNTWAPADPRLRRARLWIERLCVERASALVFCTAGARDIVIARYGAVAAAKAHVIPNGFDEDSFTAAVGDHEHTAPTGPGVVLLHSGTVYPTDDRDPSALLAAIARLKHAGAWDLAHDRIIFRASGHDTWLNAKIVEHDVADLVTLAPRIPYAEALREVCASNGLIVLQGYTSNPAIPAKVYEYIRAGRPILALAHRDGETARLLRSLGVSHIADLQDTDAIATALRAFLDALRTGTATGIPRDTARQFSRRASAQRFASLMSSITVD